MAPDRIQIAEGRTASSFAKVGGRRDSCGATTWPPHDGACVLKTVPQLYDVSRPESYTPCSTFLCGGWKSLEASFGWPRREKFIARGLGNGMNKAVVVASARNTLGALLRILRSLGKLAVWAIGDFFAAHCFASFRPAAKAPQRPSQEISADSKFAKPQFEDSEWGALLCQAMRAPITFPSILLVDFGSGGRLAKTKKQITAICFSLSPLL